MKLADWLLAPGERGNPATRLESRRPGEWRGRRGTRYDPSFTARCTSVNCSRPSAPNSRATCCCSPTGAAIQTNGLDGPGSEIGQVLCAAAERGVIVKGLIWRSHLDRFQFSERENRHLGEEIRAAGGECLLDMRVRPGGSHHQKAVILRHPGRPERDVAFVGGIDLCHSRRDDTAHRGDPLSQPFAAAYGPRPPWHDVQLAIHGPAVGDVEATFRERWEDPAPAQPQPAGTAARAPAP